MKGSSYTIVPYNIWTLSQARRNNLEITSSCMLSTAEPLQRTLTQRRSWTRGGPAQGPSWCHFRSFATEAELPEEAEVLRRDDVMTDYCIHLPHPPLSSYLFLFISPASR